MFSEISYNTKFKLLFPLFRDRLEDMRFMYETVAETAGHISFDSVDPFYDSLPWFRLIGRYVSTLNIKVDHDLSLLSPRPLYLSFYFNFLSGTRSIFSPFGLVTFYPPPPPCSCSTFPFSAFVAFFRNFFFRRVLPHSVSSSRLHWSLLSLPLHSSLTICTVCAFLLQNRQVLLF